MLKKASVLKGSLKKNNFNNCIFTTDKFAAIDDLRNMAGNQEELLIIINYSYVFASHSLEVDDIVDFTNEIIKGCEISNKAKLIIMQQNPKTQNLNNKWDAYKQKLLNLRTHETYPKLYRFKFDDELGSSNYLQPTFDVKCDILKSFL